MNQSQVEKVTENLNNKKVEDLSHDTVHVISNWSKSFLQSLGVPDGLVNVLNSAFLLTILVIVVYLIHLLLKKIINYALDRAVSITRINFLQYLRNNNFARYIAMIIPISIVVGSLSIVFFDFPQTLKLARKGMEIFMVFYTIWLVMSVVKSVADIFRAKQHLRSKPIDSFIQIIRIILYFIGFVVILALLIGKNPINILTGLGAASAILLLIFRDTILGFVASIQVSTNDMVRIGDWITMPKYDADGDVIQITLTTVKIQNFDKTISMIPTYSLISESFQNWRGMQDVGARRIKRSLNIKQSTIRYYSSADKDLQKLSALKPIPQVKAFIENYMPASAEHSVNNLSLFKTYLENYLKARKDIKHDMTVMVRYLETTSKGIPVEMYLFTDTTNWDEYETILSDIMAHAIAVVPYFGLEIYEDIANNFQLYKNHSEDKSLDEN